jgi:hypothetical protein
VRVLGVVLVVAGLIALLAGGFSFTRRREVARVGPISATVKEKQTYPVARWAGVALILAGVGLVAVGGRKRA